MSSVKILSLIKVLLLFQSKFRHTIQESHNFYFNLYSSLQESHNGFIDSPKISIVTYTSLPKSHNPISLYTCTLSFKNPTQLHNFYFSLFSSVPKSHNFCFSLYYPSRIPQFHNFYLVYTSLQKSHVIPQFIFEPIISFQTLVKL